MPGPVFTGGERVTLRTIEEEDLEFLQRWRNHPDIRVPLTDSAIRNLEQVEEYFEEQISDDDGVNLLVCIDGTDTDEKQEDEADHADVEPVGEVAIPWIRDAHGTGMLMYWIAPAHQGEGYVTEAIELLLEHAFAERRLHKVWANVIESNPGSQRVLEKLGFEREGRLREDCFIDGDFEDVYRYGLLAAEWQQR